MKGFGLAALILALCLWGALACAEEVTRMGSLEMFGADSEVRKMVAVEHLLRTHNLKADTVYDYRYGDLPSMLAALDAGEVDAVSLRSSTGRYLASQNPDYQIVDTDVQWSESFSIMTMEKNAGVYDLLNDAIIMLKENGTMDRLVRDHIEACIAGQQPEEIRIPYNYGARVIRVAVNCDMPPMDYATEEGTPAGLNAALLREIALQAHLNIEMVAIDAADRTRALSRGMVDAIFWVELFECNLDNCDNEVLCQETFEDATSTESYYTDNVVVLTLKNKA